MTHQRPSHTRAGDRLIFTFHKTTLHDMVMTSVERIEEEAYAKGYTDGMATPDEPDMDIPVIPKEPT